MPEAKSLGAPPFSISSDQHQAAQVSQCKPDALANIFSVESQCYKVWLRPSRLSKSLDREGFPKSCWDQSHDEPKFLLSMLQEMQLGVIKILIRLESTSSVS